MELADDVRPLLERAVADLAPMPDVVPAAMRLGRRRQRRRRLALASVTVVATAAVPVGVLVLPEPAAWPERVQARASGPARTGEKEFKARAAATLEALLPPRLGRVQPLDSAIGAYEATGPAGRFRITFNVLPDQDLPPKQCPPRTPGSPVITCVQGRLPDGTPVTAGHERDGQTGFRVDQGEPVSVFGYQDTMVTLALFADETADRPVPITDPELLAVVTDPRFVALVDAWAGSPALLGPAPDMGTAQPSTPDLVGNAPR